MIHVSFDNKKYKLEVQKEYVFLNESGFSKKVLKMNCNRIHFDDFISHFQKYEPSLLEVRSKEFLKSAIQVIVEDKMKIALRHTAEGIFFSDLPSKFKNLWLTSERLCKK